MGIVGRSRSNAKAIGDLVRLTDHHASKKLPHCMCDEDCGARQAIRRTPLIAAS